MSEGVIVQESGKARWRLSIEPGRRSRLHEEIEQDQKGSEKSENHTAGNGVAGNAAKRTDKIGGDSFETRIRARAIEGADNGIARKAAAREARLVMDPIVNFIAAAPDQSSAQYEEQIAHNRENSERRALTPKHVSSQSPMLQFKKLK